MTTTYTVHTTRSARVLYSIGELGVAGALRWRRNQGDVLPSIALAPSDATLADCERARRGEFRRLRDARRAAARIELFAGITAAKIGKPGVTVFIQANDGRYIKV